MTQRVKLLLVGIAIVVFAVIIWFLVLSPIRGEIAETEANIENEQNLVMLANTALRQAEVTRTEGTRNQRRLLELAKMVPMSQELPSLLLQIQDLADQAGIEFIQVTPGSPTAIEGASFQQLPLELQFSGTYFDVSDFIYRAEQMVAGPGRLLAIKTVDLSPATEEGAAGGTNPRLQVNMSVYAFVFGTEPSAPPVVTPPPATGGEGDG